MKFWNISGYLLAGVLVTTAAYGQDPVDKNFGGPYLGGQFTVGQMSPTRESTPGPAYLMGVDVGYGIKRDTWNRIELGLSLESGKAGYTDKEDPSQTKVDLDLDLVALIKVGYAYSLGDSAFAVLRAGVGIVDASYSGKRSGFSIDGGSSTGVATMIAWDAFFPASDRLDFLAGASLRQFNFSFGDLDQSFQVNMPSLYLGARARL